MARINNQVMLIGNLGADPIIKTFENGQRMARMSIATDERKHSLRGETKSMVKWHNLVAWGTTADIVSKMLKKGGRIALEGRINNRSWEDKSGQKHRSTEIVVRDFTLLR